MQFGLFIPQGWRQDLVGIPAVEEALHAPAYRALRQADLACHIHVGGAAISLQKADELAVDVVGLVLVHANTPGSRGSGLLPLRPDYSTVYERRQSTGWIVAKFVTEWALVRRPPA